MNGLCIGPKDVVETLAIMIMYCRIFFFVYGMKHPRQHQQRAPLRFCVRCLRATRCSPNKVWQHKFLVYWWGFRKAHAMVIPLFYFTLFLHHLPHKPLHNFTSTLFSFDLSSYSLVDLIPMFPSITITFHTFLTSTTFLSPSSQHRPLFLHSCMYSY